MWPKYISHLGPVKIISRDSFAVRIEWWLVPFSGIALSGIFRLLKYTSYVSPYTTSESHLITGCHAACAFTGPWCCLVRPPGGHCYVCSSSDTLSIMSAPLSTMARKIIMLRASSGALRLYAISTRPASTATVAIFKDSLSFSTELSLHRQRRARGSEATSTAER